MFGNVLLWLHMVAVGPKRRYHAGVRPTRSSFIGLISPIFVRRFFVAPALAQKSISAVAMSRDGDCRSGVAGADHRSRTGERQHGTDIRFTQMRARRTKTAGNARLQLTRMLTQRHWASRLMRHRLRKFLPIVLIALAVQLVAPIAACWSAAIAASDPLSSLEICHSDPTAPPGSTDPHAQDGSCPICCLAQSQASFDTPQPAAFSIPQINAAPVIWREDARAVLRSRSHSHAQARAPPRSA